MNDQVVNNQTSGTQKGGAKVDADQKDRGETGKRIAESIARDRRPVTQIGSDVDYVGVMRGARNLIVAVVALVALLVGLSLFVKVQEVARARRIHSGATRPGHPDARRRCARSDHGAQ